MSDAIVPQPAEPDPVPFEVRRQAVIDRIQQALAEDHIEFEEIDDRLGAVYRADTTTELEAIAADLPELDQPPPPATARHLAPATRFSLLGDVKVGGWLAFESELRVIGIVGDVTVDLSTAQFEPEGITVHIWSLLGDTKVILPEGARVQVQTTTLVGDNKEAVSPPMDGGPLVRIRSYSFIGDTKIYSLSLVPVGALRRMWTALRRRND